MMGLGMPEIVVILVIALIFFGPRKLPELGRSLGRTMNEFKKASNELRSTLEDEIRVEEQKDQRAKAETERPAVAPAALVPESPASDSDAVLESASVSEPVAPDEPTVSRTTSA